MSAGRPTKYSEEMLASAQAYVQHCRDAQQMPFVEELALTLEVNEDTVVEWAKLHDAFSATVKRLKMLQKLYLKRGALEKKLHPTLSIFLLKANHGMNEEEKPPESDQTIHIHYVGTDPKTLDDAIANKNAAVSSLAEAERAIEKFSSISETEHASEREVVHNA